MSGSERGMTFASLIAVFSWKTVGVACGLMGPEMIAGGENSLTRLGVRARY